MNQGLNNMDVISSFIIITLQSQYSPNSRMIIEDDQGYTFYDSMDNQTDNEDFLSKIQKQYECIISFIDLLKIKSRIKM